MELDSIECVSYSDGMEDDDDAAAVTSAQLPRPFLKSASSAGSAAAAVNVVVVSDRAGAAGPGGAGPGAGPLVISPATGVHELLECPVCTNSMYPPIHQCQNGHTLCSTCKTRVHNRCPTCRQELGDIRCLALEKVAESLELPCKYYSLGCPEVFPYYSKLKHESQCNFRPYNCPYAGSECSVVGDIPFLVAHLRDDHKVDMHSGCTFNHRYVKSNPREVENATWMLTISCWRIFTYRTISGLQHPLLLKSKTDAQCMKQINQNFLITFHYHGFSLFRAVLLLALRGLPAWNGTGIHGFPPVYG
ncbi:hypothetical protein GQ55_1G131100 [Panicum hallii var. hallii]|uniref:RING-type E3 ubiquitin transferase n=2 Tax=Panicum hallii TaxID=206008 RepID=A0A2T7F550_9POAL|nr:hypothetical protein PAHAL_1G135600 [Panicum hallii]PUZ75195.1 hypothetical protein GQ55_1G131100 [Panicum hallii var. hallii]